MCCLQAYDTAGGYWQYQCIGAKWICLWFSSISSHLHLLSPGPWRSLPMSFPSLFIRHIWSVQVIALPNGNPSSLPTVLEYNADSSPCPACPRDTLISFLVGEHTKSWPIQEPLHLLLLPLPGILLPGLFTYISLSHFLVLNLSLMSARWLSPVNLETLASLPDYCLPTCLFPM